MLAIGKITNAAHFFFPQNVGFGMYHGMHLMVLVFSISSYIYKDISINFCTYISNIKCLFPGL